MVSEEQPPVEEEELYSSWALLIQTSLLICALWTSYFLQIRKIRAIHETVVSIFAGMFVGLIIRLSPGLIIQKMVTFNQAYFFNLLLPPIILNSGYEMKKENFFRNFGTILVFALIGTFISALVTGFLVAILGLIGIVALSFLDSMIFGAILSATDPVTVLAIFQTFKVDPKLYSIIFGESILNDAVAIVLYETLKQFRGQDLHFSNIIRGIGTFMAIFTASLLIGVVIAILCALMLKFSQLSKYPAIESCVIGLIAYNAYFFSNGLQMSGIVSLLFCGITLKHYAYDNMSLRTKRTTKYMFRVMAQLSENFIFIYLGLTLFTSTDLQYEPLFIFFTAIIICVSRYAAVFPLANLINTIARYRKRAEHLPHTHQVMLFWAGLRGAVAFALAPGLSGEHAASMQTTILVVVVLSVIVFGGTTSRMLEILRIRTGVEDDNSGDSDLDDVPLSPKYDEFEDEDFRNHPRSTSGDRYHYQNHSPQDSLNSADSVLSMENSLLSGSATAEARAKSDQTHWFMSFDDRFLKPIFTRHKPERYSPGKEQWRQQNLTRRSVGDSNRLSSANDGGEDEALIRLPQSARLEIFSSTIATDNAKSAPIASTIERSNVSLNSIGSRDGNNAKNEILTGTKFEVPPIDNAELTSNDFGDQRFQGSGENVSLRSITPAGGGSTGNLGVKTEHGNNQHSHGLHVLVDSEDEDEEPLLDFSSHS